MYTVKQLSDLAGVTRAHAALLRRDRAAQAVTSARTATAITMRTAVLRLQQILFYREMGLELLQIKEILD